MTNSLSSQQVQLTQQCDTDQLVQQQDCHIASVDVMTELNQYIM